MPHRLLSLVDPPPPGFQFCPALTGRDVRRGAFCLHVRDLSSGIRALESFPRSSPAIIVTEGPEMEWGRIGENRYHLALPALEISQSSQCIVVPLTLLELNESLMDRVAANELELKRAQEDRRKTREEFNSVRQSLFREMHERRQAEEQYRQAQNMESIGRLAGGIAHEFNNLLGGIMGFADLLLFNLNHSTLEYSYAHSILKAARKASDLTRQLLAFSRRGRLATTHIDVHAALEEVASLLQRALGPAIEIGLDLRSSKRIILGDPGQIQSLLLNLGVNAGEAMPHGGKLTCSTRLLPLRDNDLPEGDYIEISISDTGAGIPPDVLPHIFEPFFTIKEDGKGAGLGLAAAFGTVQEHHGSIFATSTLGRGTTFIVRLPLTELREPATDSPCTSANHKNECVLLIDDDPMLRELGQELLTSLGHEVYLAASGFEGIEICKQLHDRLSFVLLDMTMPKLSGPETFAELRKIDEDLKIIICSGYNFNAEVKAMIDKGAVGFLQKPFRLVDLTTLLTSTKWDVPHPSH